MTAAAPVVLYRIGTDTPTYESDDASGTGAKIEGGRWNRPGSALLYTSTSRALACLETLVHLARRSRFPFNRYLVEVTVQCRECRHSKGVQLPSYTLCASDTLARHHLSSHHEVLATERIRAGQIESCAGNRRKMSR